MLNQARQSIDLKYPEIFGKYNIILTPTKNTMNGKSVRPKKVRESSLGGSFSGALKMWVISAFGPYLEYESTGCGGGWGAFSGGSGRSRST